MHTKLFGVVGAGLMAVGAQALAADLHVVFVQPETYADAGYSRTFASEREQVQRDIEPAISAG